MVTAGTMASPPKDTREDYERLEPDAHAAILAARDSSAAQAQRELESRQIQIGKWRVTLFGDADRFKSAERRAIEAQERVRERDLLLQERVRATRERNDAERQDGGRPE